MQTNPPEQGLDIGLVIVGDEILSGKRADKHMPKLIELLAARGLQLAWAEYVGDSPERITATLQRAFASGDLVFSCGGIGATPGRPHPPVRGQGAWRGAGTASRRPKR